MNRLDFDNPAGVLVEEDGYDAFIPESLPPPIRYDQRTVSAVIRAERSLEELKTLTPVISDVPVRCMVDREVVQSSRIEGVEVTLESMVRDGIDGGDIGEPPREAVNCRVALNEMYRNAMLHGCTRDVIRRAHRTLWDDIQGAPSGSGEFRVRQNWIGHPGSSIFDSVYNPPPPRYLPSLLEDLETFIGGPSDIPDVVRCAMVHYQFETIHPFSDGNGRVGRMIAGVMLAAGINLQWPIMDISSYMNEYRSQYYARMVGVRTCSRWNEWIIFFADAVSHAAGNTANRIRDVQKTAAGYRKTAKSANGIRLVDMLVENPYATIPRVRTRLGVTYPTAKSLVESFVESGILQEVRTDIRPRLFCAQALRMAVNRVSRRVRTRRAAPAPPSGHLHRVPQRPS